MIEVPTSLCISVATPPQSGSVPEPPAFIVCPTTTESPRYNMFPGALSTKGSVPEQNLDDLFNQQLYQDIEKILDSRKYTKDVLQAWILNPQRVEFANEANFFDFFYRVCTDRSVPFLLVGKILHVLGEKHLNSFACVDCIKSIVTSNRHTEHKIFILLEAFEILKDLEAKSSILATVLISSNNDRIVLAVLESEYIEKEMLLIRHEIITEVDYDGMTKSVTENDLEYSRRYRFFEHDATMLEIALHKKMQLEIVKALIEKGGKELLLLSKRSLLRGALLEYVGKTALQLVQYLLDEGGRDLVMNEKGWKLSRHEDTEDEKTSILYFLCYHRRTLCRNIGLVCVAQMMKTLIEIGGRELVMRLSYSDISILDEFQYFEHEEFVPIIRLLVDIGGIELLSRRSGNFCKNYTILHRLCNEEGPDIPNEVWKMLACNKEMVMMVDSDGQTALHLACKANRRDCIAVLLEQGGKDLVFKLDKKKNTALHYLPSTRKKDNAHFEIAEKILCVGGRELLECINRSKNTPFIPFITKALEFKFESASDMIKSGDTNIDEDIIKQDNLGKTALHIACERNNYNDVRSLLERGGKALTMMRDARGNTALHLLKSAQRKNCSDFEIAEMILNVGGKELLQCENNAKRKPFLPFITKAIDFQFDLLDSIPDHINSVNNDAIGILNSSSDSSTFDGSISEKIRALEEENKRLKAELYVKNQEITRLKRQGAMTRSREEDTENDVSEHFVTPYKKAKVSEVVLTSTNSTSDLDPNSFEFSL